MVISKIKYDFFYLDFLLFQTKKLLLHDRRDEKEKAQKHTLNKLKKFPRLKSFIAVFRPT